MRAKTFLLIFSGLLIFQSACVREKNPNKEIPAQLLGKFPKKSFAYPVGEKDFVSERNDRRDS